MEGCKKTINRLYGEFLRGVMGDKVHPAPAFPWGGCNKCSSSEDRGWAEVFKSHPCDLLEDGFLSVSSKRSSGMAAWDAAVACGAMSHRLEPVPGVERRTEDVPTVCNTNEFYRSGIWKCIADGVHSPYVVDLEDSAYPEMLLDFAHTLAHVRGDVGYRKSGYWHTYCATSYFFAEAAAEIAVATAFDLPVDFNRYPILPYGIRALPSPRIGFNERRPAMQLPVDVAKNDVDKIGAYVCVSVEPGHDPISHLEDVDSKVSDNDWWSYQPRKLVLVGWDTPLGLCSRDLTSMSRVGWEPTFKRKAFTEPCDDLMPITSLQSYLEEAKGTPPGDSFKPLSWWVENSSLLSGRTRTPFLPCTSCLLFHPSVDNGLRAPAKWRIFSNEIPRWVDKKGLELDNSKVLKDHKELLKKALKSVWRSKMRYVGTAPDVAAFKRLRASRRRLWDAHIKEERKKWKRRRRS